MFNCPVEAYIGLRASDFSSSNVAFTDRSVGAWNFLLISEQRKKGEKRENAAKRAKEKVNAISFCMSL